MKSALTVLLTKIKIQRLKLCLGLVGLLIIESALLVIETPSIESDIARRTDEMLQQRGFKRIEVGISGRDVILRGSVSSMTAQEYAIRFSRYVQGVRSVATDFEIRPLRLPHLKISRSVVNVLRVEGEVPTQKLVSQMSDLASNSISHDRVINLLYADPEVTDPTWIDAVQGIVVEGDQLSGVEIVIGANQFSLGGLIASESDYNVLVQRIRQFAGGQQLEFINKIGIEPRTEFSTQAPKNKISLSSQPLDTTVLNLELGLSPNDEYEETVNKPIAKLLSDLSVLAPDMTSETNSSVNSEQIASLKLIDEQNRNPAETDEEDSGNNKLESSTEPNVVAVQNTQPIIEETVQNIEPETVADSENLLEACQNEVDDSMAANSITFLPNSSKNTVDNDTIINKIAKILLECPTLYVKIAGYTDSSGNLQKNYLLSTQRAESVMRSLIDWGIHANMISAQGYGPENPVAPNQTLEGRQLNRRIEITVSDH